jgi:hypothetical protein
MRRVKEAPEAAVSSNPAAGAPGADRPSGRSERAMSREDRPQALAQPEEVEKETVEEKLGTHPIGAAAGAVGGTLAGAVIGAAAGPVGSLAGAVAGATLGSGLGASASEAQSPVVGTATPDTSTHDAYWRESYAARPYIPSGANYDDYEPAYRYGTQAYLRTDHPRAWDEVEAELKSGWEDARGRSRLQWADARHAVRDAWVRLYEGG